MHVRTARTILYALAVLASGCGSTPPSHFYTLSATTVSATDTSMLSIAVGPVSVPAVVDRPQIVVSTGPNEVRLDELNRWAAPLQDNLSRVVADELGGMLGTPRVRLFSQALSTDADYRVMIDVQRFESTLGEAAVLDARWTVRRLPAGKSQAGRTNVTENVRNSGFGALASAHSRAVERMSRQIGDAILSLEQDANGLRRSGNHE